MPDSAAKCGSDSTFVDARDDRRYRCVTIGTQTWMAENLDYEYEIDGSSYGNWCYNDSAQYCARYGRLYTYGAAVDSATTGCGYGKICQASDNRIQGVCPDGWHVPGKDEFEFLFDAVGGAANAGSVLGTNDLSGEDAYGFSALPGGERDATGKFVTGGSYAYFWTKTARSRESAWTMLLRNDNAAATPLDNFKKRGYSVRCVKD